MVRAAWMILVGIFAYLAPALAYDAKEPTVKTIESLTQVEAHVSTLAAKYGAGRTLVVFDIDNTLLTMDQVLGSDAWFNWQRGLLKQEPKPEDAVSKTFDGLLAVQYLLYGMSDMKPTQESTQPLLETLQERGHPVMALTARGPQVRSATLRELGDSEMYFQTAPRCRLPLCGRRGQIPPSQVVWAAELAMVIFPNIADWLEQGRTAARAIGYGNGVMMVAGQDKGVMLQLLLASSDLARYRAVVFVDDGENNIENVARAFRHPRLEVVALHYTRFNKSVDSLPTDPKRKKKAKADWQKVRLTVCTVFARFCDKE